MSTSFLSVLVSITAASGVALIFFGRSVPALRVPGRIRRHRAFHDTLERAGLRSITSTRLCALVTLVACSGALIGWVAFGGALVPLVSGLLAGAVPVVTVKSRAELARSAAGDAWPRMIEEIRLRCGSLGQAIPQALLETGLEGPESMRDAFRSAQREWLVSTDFARTVAVLKGRLADPTADITCETLLMAHAVGGSDVGARLSALAADRRRDCDGRREARSKQAGVRFARRFVVVVPAGMALVGMSIGDGRAAYESSLGQLGVAFALLILAGCWMWAGRLIRLPSETRVFRDH